MEHDPSIERYWREVRSQEDEDFQRQEVPRDSQGFLRVSGEEDTARQAPLYRWQDISRRHRFLLLSGPPGIGKSIEMKRAAAFEAAATGDRVLVVKLLLCDTVGELRRAVCESSEWLAWREDTGELHLFLDGLDEFPLGLARLMAVLEEGRVDPKRLFLRISSRSTRPQDETYVDLEPAFGKPARYELAPLDKRAVERLATRHRITDLPGFLDRIVTCSAVGFAEAPLTLEFLCRMHRSGEGWPKDRTTLFERCILDHCREHRSHKGSPHRITVEERVELAGGIALATLLSATPRIYGGAHPGASSRSVCVPSLLDPDTGRQERSALCEQVLDTRLFTATGDGLATWAHASFEEFLAARHLHRQAMNLAQLTTILFEQHTGFLHPRLAATALHLAAMDPAIFEQILRRDPLWLLDHEIPAGERPRVAVSILRQAGELRLTDPPWASRELLYGRLAEPRLAEALHEFVADSTANTVVRRIAIDIAEATGCRALVPLLTEVATTSGENEHVRFQAVSAVGKLGTKEEKSALKPLLALPAAEDPDDQILGACLWMLWPGLLTTEELLRALRPPQPWMIGHYSSFVRALPNTVEHLDLPTAISWVAHRPRGDREEARLEPLADAIVAASWQRRRDPEVWPRIVELAGAVLGHGALKAPGGNAPPLGGEERRELLAALLEHHLDERNAHRAVQSQPPLCVAGDLSWLLERLDATPGARERGALRCLVLAIAHRTDPGDQAWTNLRAAAARHADLGGALRRRFAEVTAEEEHASRPDVALDDEDLGADSGEAEGVDWPAARWLEWIEGDGDICNLHDLAQAPGFEQLIDEEPLRLSSAAVRLLSDWPADDGFPEAMSALRILYAVAPDRLAQSYGLPKWTIPLLDYQSLGDELEDHRALAAEAYRLDPQLVLGYLDQQIDTGSHGRVIGGLDLLSTCMDPRLELHLKQWLRQGVLAPSAAFELLRALFVADPDKGRSLTGEHLAGWWPDIEADPSGFGREVINALIVECNVEPSRFLAMAGIEHSARLLAFLGRHGPARERRRGIGWVSPEVAVVEFRSLLLQALSYTGTVEAFNALRGLEPAATANAEVQLARLSCGRQLVARAWEPMSFEATQELLRGAGSPRVFLCYRRAQSSYACGHLRAHLVERFGSTNVFQDDRSVPPGENLRRFLELGVDGSEAMLVLIGEGWAAEIQRRASAQETDDVRRELELAFEKRLFLVPLLLDGVELPTSDELPTSIAELSSLLAMRLRAERFEEDSQKIAATIQQRVIERRSC